MVNYHLSMDLWSNSIKELGEDRLISHNEDKETYPDIYPDDEPIDAIGEVLGKV